MKTKSCPNCQEMLNIMARACACGWREAPKSKFRADEHHIVRDHQCTWRANEVRCRFPVGFFDIGAVDGFCDFHRNQKNGATGAEWVKLSQNASRRDYLVMVSGHVYGHSNGCSEVTLDEEIKYERPYSEAETEAAKQRSFETAKRLGMMQIFQGE